MQHRGGETDPMSFPGIELSDMWELEEFFEIDICVFEFKDNDSCLVMWSSGRKSHIIHLNVIDNHFSLIMDVAAYSKTLTCDACSRCFVSKNCATEHQCASKDRVHFRFKGSSYTQRGDLFSRQRDFGINVSEENRFHPYRATFDIEPYLYKANVPHPLTNEYTRRNTTSCLCMCVRMCHRSIIPNVLCIKQKPQGILFLFAHYLLKVAKQARGLRKRSYRRIREEPQAQCNELVHRMVCGRKGDDWLVLKRSLMYIYPFYQSSASSDRTMTSML